MLNQFILPWGIVGVLIVVGKAGKLRVRGGYDLLAAMIIAVLLLLPYFLWANPRYFAYLFPLGAIALACAARELHLRNRLLEHCCSLERPAQRSR